uniref:rRNA-processing protein EFG1 n=1 Tax=Noccaea caerulescens TaxID=107243 RepID=A0A1J3CEF0_NOCCA
MPTGGLRSGLRRQDPVGDRKDYVLRRNPKKNQIRSIGRMIRKDLPPEVREALEKKLDDLKKQQDIHIRLAVERKIFLRNRKIRFFERRKIERRIRRLEKLQRNASGGHLHDAEIGGQLSKL